jgi:AraC-like DNA-binding protein
LANIFQKNVNISPKQYLIDTRMARAKLLLKTKQYKIKDVSRMVGYKNQLHFSNEFKRYYGVSPLNYENKELD